MFTLQGQSPQVVCSVLRQPTFRRSGCVLLAIWVLGSCEPPVAKHVCGLKALVLLAQQSVAVSVVNELESGVRQFLCCFLLSGDYGLGWMWKFQES